MIVDVREDHERILPGLALSGIDVEANLEQGLNRAN